MWLCTLEAKDSLVPWIVGVFKERQELEQYLFSISSHPLLPKSPKLQITEINASDYPVLFLCNFETNEFSHINIGELANKLSEFTLVDDEDHQYGIYYTFREDWRAIIPEDQKYWQLMEHHHIDCHEIERLIWRGLRTQLAGGYPGIYTCDWCDKMVQSSLTESGYPPPQGWQIFYAEERYMTVCSENCHDSFNRDILDQAKL